MSVSKYRWTEECDTHICVGDCDLCDYEDETYTVEEPTISYKGE